MHRLAKEELDSLEADAIRDSMDGPWELLTETERQRARMLSSDLNVILESKNHQ